jgi:hypothetical protein
VRRPVVPSVDELLLMALSLLSHRIVAVDNPCSVRDGNRTGPEVERLAATYPA